jgi:hypothetical protein
LLGGQLNGVLKARFQQLQKEVINLNLTSVIDDVFAKNVISQDDLSLLNDIKVTGKKSSDEKSRALMVLLHKSDHPEAFLQLRLAIKEEPAYSWFIDRLDDDQSNRLSQLKLGNCCKHSV